MFLLYRGWEWHLLINTKRLSYDIIHKSKRFCNNIPDFDMIDIVDFCGNNSGRDVDKFAICNLSKTYILNDFILINQCKIHILCEVETILELGSHRLFIARVTRVTSKYTSIENMESLHDVLCPIAYYRPYYYRLEKAIRVFTDIQK